MGYLLDAELKERHNKRVELNLQFARFPYVKRLEDFDYAAQPSIDSRLMEIGVRALFKHGPQSAGPPDVGKTYLAIALGVKVTQMGHRVYFTTAMDLARKLAKALMKIA